jgi:hypothetical protein
MSEDEILEAMQIYGGSFVKQLAVLYRLGDPVNRRILIDGFKRYFDEYAEIARLKYEREHQA